MKGLVIFCLVAVFGLANCGEDAVKKLLMKLKDVDTYSLKKIRFPPMDEFGSRLEQICPGSKTKFESALEESKSCIEKTVKSSDTVCSIWTNKLPTCLEPVMRVIEDCMPQQSKDVPQSMLNSTLKGLDFKC